MKNVHQCVCWNGCAGLFRFISLSFEWRFCTEHRTLQVNVTYSYIERTWRNSVLPHRLSTGLGNSHWGIPWHHDGDMGLPVVLVVLLLNEWAQWIPHHVEVLTISNCTVKELQSRSTRGWHTPVSKPCLVHMRRPVHAVTSIHCTMTLNVTSLIPDSHGHKLQPRPPSFETIHKR